MIELLDRLHASGELRRMIEAGLLSGTVEIWRLIYHDYEKELSSTGSIMQAMSNAADNNGVTVRTIRYIRERMEG